MTTNDTLYNTQEVVHTKPPLVNVKRVVARSLRFWYLLVASVLAGLAIAYVVNRYTTRIYPIKASIIIKENEEILGDINNIQSEQEANEIVKEELNSSLNELGRNVNKDKAEKRKSIKIKQTK